ncbi:MAG: tripartite tricarboxylate transporter substrate-binding protein, partial [bacterium]
GPALTDVLGGQIQVLMGSIPSTTQHVKMNRLRGISVTTSKRSALVPDIPTIAETLPGYEAVLWYGVWGPKNLPANVVNRWNKDLDALIQLSDMRERMSKEGVEPAGGSPQQFKIVLARDIAKWTKVAREAKVVIDQ